MSTKLLSEAPEAAAEASPEVEVVEDMEVVAVAAVPTVVVAVTDMVEVVVDTTVAAVVVRTKNLSFIKQFTNFVFQATKEDQEVAVATREVVVEDTLAVAANLVVTREVVNPAAAVVVVGKYGLELARLSLFSGQFI